MYLDAAFFPKLDKWDFLQEGHRLEVVPLEQAEDADEDGEAVVVPPFLSHTR